MIYDFTALQNKMKEKGMTQRKLSKKTGIPLTTLSDKLNGRTEFKATEMRVIADVLELDSIEGYFLVPKVQ